MSKYQSFPTWSIASMGFKLKSQKVVLWILTNGFPCSGGEAEEPIQYWKTNDVGGLTLPNFKTEYKATANNQVRVMLAKEWTSRSVQQNRKLQVDPHQQSQRIFLTKDQRQHNAAKRAFSNNSWHHRMQEKKEKKVSKHRPCNLHKN